MHRGHDDIQDNTCDAPCPTKDFPDFGNTSTGTESTPEPSSNLRFAGRCLRVFVVVDQS
jgi:hypothetical protein